MKLKSRFIVILGMLAITALACNLGSRAATPPASPIPVTTEAVKILEENVQKAYEEAQASGKVDLVVTEQQLTSTAAFELQDQDQTQISDPQIFLREGQIQVFGTVKFEEIYTQVQIILTVQPDANGKPDFNIVSAKLGPLPVPDAMLSEMEKNLDQTFSEQLESLAPETFIESITVADGEMHIIGHTR